MHSSPTSDAQDRNHAPQGEVLALLQRVIDSLTALELIQSQLVRELRHLHPLEQDDKDDGGEPTRDRFAYWCRAYGLTERESQTLAALLTGATNRKIGRDLGIAERTVKNALHSIYLKLGVSGRSEAISRTLQNLH